MKRYGLLNPGVGNGGGSFDAFIEIVAERLVAHGQIEYQILRYEPLRRRWTKRPCWGNYSVLVLPSWLCDHVEPLSKSQREERENRVK